MDGLTSIAALFAAVAGLVALGSFVLIRRFMRLPDLGVLLAASSVFPVVLLVALSFVVDTQMYGPKAALFYTAILILAGGLLGIATLMISRAVHRWWSNTGQ